MASCKDCLSYCSCGWTYNAEHCKHFKDRNKFVELPCKKGDTVYRINEYDIVVRDEVNKVTYYEGTDDFIICFRFGLPCNKDTFEKTCFLTPDQAEQALKEREKC